MNELVEKYCTDEVAVQFIFMPFKVGQYFSNKDQIPRHLISHVVYKFQCAQCNLCYFGETIRHFTTHVNEHLETDKASAVYKHLHENVDCNRVCNTDCFSVVDRASIKFQLRIKEGLLISKYKPVLNGQVRSYNPGIL